MQSKKNLPTPSRFTREAAGSLCDAIEDVHGREVLAVGKLDEEGLVSAVSIVARGNEVSVPALMPFMEKGDVAIHNHPSGTLGPSNADLQVASQLGNQGIGFFIVDNEVEHVYVVAEAAQPRSIEPLDSFPLLRHLTPGGALNRLVDYFEPRDAQLEMLESVVDALNDDQIAAIEAGTGVGKSLAYLIPLLEWVRQNDERVVVSTATINLQQQLVEKDIPLAAKILGVKDAAVLVKGRGNYLCLRRLEESLQEAVLFRDEDHELQSLRAWSETTRDGSRSDLASPVEDKLWNRIASTTDTCTGLRCHFRDECFVIRARRSAGNSRLLVANHHLLFSDLSLRLAGAGYEATAVLPPFQRIVLDEAHNIEKSATSFFSATLNRFALDRTLSLLYRQKRGRNLGSLIALSRLLGKNRPLTDLAAIVSSIIERAETLDRTALELIADRNYRFHSAGDSEISHTLIELLSQVQEAILSLTNRISHMLEAVEEKDLEKSAVVETEVAGRRLQDLAAVPEMFRNWTDHPEKVFWIEKAGGKLNRYANFVVSPLEVSRVMREALFDRYETVICTSATLTVGEDFSFWSRRVGLSGLDSERARSYRYPSPFPYKQSVLLGVPKDAPYPDDASYIDFVADFLRSLLTISHGHALVLFTSYSMLQQVFDSVSPTLDERGISALRQGIQDRSRLLREFTSDSTSVLFATDSFWEGVDAPGESLQVVVICRLPFRVPTEPVVEARLEAITARGGNAFTELSLPEAVIRMKQGFGRLVRRTSDRGVVMILDPRIIRKSYGGLFLASLPETRRSTQPTADILKEVESFLNDFG